MHCVDGRVLLHVRVVAGPRCPRACTPRHRYACACLCGFPVAHLKTQTNDLSVYIYIYFHDAKRCHHCINPSLHECVFTKDPWWILFHPPHVLPLTYLCSLRMQQLLMTWRPLPATRQSGPNYYGASTRKHVITATIIIFLIIYHNPK